MLASRPASELLLLLYISFSWSFAFGIFLLESSRLKLLKQNSAARSGTRLALYSLLAILLTLFTVPDAGTIAIMDRLLLIAATVIYGFAAGLVYYSANCRR